MREGMAELGLSQSMTTSNKAKKKNKMVIPLHENLPKEDYKEKEAPEEFAELKYVEMAGSVNNSMQEGNRLDGSKNENLYKTFKDRLSQVNALRLLCRTIK